MTFPVINGQNTNNGAATTTATANLPTGIVTGELLLLWHVTDYDSTAFTTPTGWTSLHQSTPTSSVRMALFYRIADGTEGSTISITQGSRAYVNATFRISGHDSTAHAPVVATAQNSFGAVDPPSCTPGGGALDYKWLAMGCRDADTNAWTSPTNYTELVDLNRATCPSLSIAHRDVNGSSENPGTFTNSGTGVWGAMTLGVWPGTEGNNSNRTGTLSVTLDNATSAATGTVLVQGALAVTLAALSSSGSSAGVKIQGSLSATLADVTLVATGVKISYGTASITLDNVTSAATGKVVIQGTSSITLGALSSSGSSANVKIQGVLNTTLQDASLAATGQVIVKGSLSSTLGDVTLSAQGQSTSANTGTLSVTLADATLSATGKVVIQGTSSVTLGNVTSAATGQVIVKGSANITLGNVLSSGAGAAIVKGVLNTTLADATLVAAAKRVISMVLNATLADAALAGAGTVAVKGALSVTLADAMLAATGEAASERVIVYFESEVEILREYLTLELLPESVTVTLLPEFITVERITG